MQTLQPGPTAPPAPAPDPGDERVGELLVPVRRGRLARARAASRALASDLGQGTVEYVGLLLLMATVLAAVVAAAGTLGGKKEIGEKVVTQIGKSIDKAGGGER
ncbi:MAG: hypothetical protein J7513_03115 [Solirubrobacteraceae bacterium]|nr:hypothetical protein [Solirubrobacteraceae bacterium]